MYLYPHEDGRRHKMVHLVGVCRLVHSWCLSRGMIEGISKCWLCRASRSSRKSVRKSVLYQVVRYGRPSHWESAQSVKEIFYPCRLVR